MNWFGDIAEIINGDRLYGEHDGAPDTAHKFRWVYSDRTPVRGELGEWISCTDCDPQLEESCDDCIMVDGRHTYACQINWDNDRDDIINAIVNLVDLAVEDFRAGNLTVDDLTAAIEQARELAAADDILFTEIVEEFDAATFNTIEAAGIIA